MNPAVTETICKSNPEERQESLAKITSFIETFKPITFKFDEKRKYGEKIKKGKFA